MIPHQSPLVDADMRMAYSADAHLGVKALGERFSDALIVSDTQGIACEWDSWASHACDWSQLGKARKLVRTSVPQYAMCFCPGSSADNNLLFGGVAILGYVATLL
jgi:hypothetical protein